MWNTQIFKAVTAGMAGVMYTHIPAKFTLTLSHFEFITAPDLNEALSYFQSEKKDMYTHILKGQFIPKSKIHIFLLPVELIINPDSFDVSCLVLEISAIEISTFSII